jgi:hypothetical protein
MDICDGMEVDHLAAVVNDDAGEFASIRTIMFMMNAEDYAWAMDRMVDVIEREGFAGTFEVLVWLLDEWDRRDAADG